MRYAFAVTALIHAVCHLPGLVTAWNWMEIPELPHRTTLYWGKLEVGEAGIRALGVMWLAVAVLFAATAMGAALRTSWWLRWTMVGVVVSLVLCSAMLPEARLGLVANVLLLGMVCLVVRYPGDKPAVGNPTLEALWATERPGMVRLRMRGEIRIGGWHPFVAEEVIAAGRGMIWAGTVSMSGLPVVGADQILDGSGSLNWRLLDWFAVAQGAGPEISRSAAGRLAGEAAAWMPSLKREGSQGVFEVEQVEQNEEGTRVKIASFGETTWLTIRRDPSGRVHWFCFPRWGNPDGGAHRYVEFGVQVEEEKKFGEHVLPSRIRAGWYFGTDRFAKEGEFFRATIEDAQFSD